MKAIVDEISIEESCNLNIRVRTHEVEHNLTFTLPPRFVPSTDLIALSITTLFGEKYKEIVFDFPITTKVKFSIEKITKASVKALKLAVPQTAPPPKNYVLNFSGGFDSLAAWAVMPEDTKLASLDFGGAFKREAEFFTKFDTTIIKTNFRNEGFARNHWTFMGIAPILLRDFFQAKSYSFGSILEGSDWNLRQSNFKGIAQPVFAAAGLRMFNPILGLTEIGAIKLLNAYSKDLTHDSLRSLAAPGSEKYKRKMLLLEAVRILSEGGKARDLTSTNITPELKFGSSVPSDFRTLYLINKLGVEIASLLSSDIPSEAIEFSTGKSFHFYERLNPTFTQPWTPQEKAHVYSKCLNAGIDLYTEHDYQEYRQTTNFLSKWHKNLQNIN